MGKVKVLVVGFLVCFSGICNLSKIMAETSHPIIFVHGLVDSSEGLSYWNGRVLGF